VVARGTADELKDHLGGDVLEVCVVNPADLEKAFSILSRFGTTPPRVDRDLKRIGAPIKGGAKVLIEAGRALDDGGIELEDLGIRRPSLDDVFLSLTGHATSTDRIDR
jgi:ABC-2 type transport system ATP-binding protein